MANIELLISKLDCRLRSLHQERSLVTKTDRIGNLEQGYLSEYIRLTTSGGIIPGVEFIILDSLSKYFNLYEDDREHQQILAAMASELNDTTSSDILASAKIIQNAYPSIYLLTQERLKEPEARSKLVIGIAVIITAICGAVISNTFNKSLSPSSSTTGDPSQIPSTLTPATSPPIPSSQQDVTPTEAVVATPSPERTVTVQASTPQNSPVISEDRQSSLSTLSYQSHCTLLSEQNTSENIIDDNCNISQTIDGKNYTLNWTSGEASHIEIITDRQAIINGEQAIIVQKNGSGITISFSKGRIGWDLK